MKYILTCLLSLGLSAFHLTHAGSASSILRFETKQGIPVVFYQTMEIPMLNISLAFRAGSAYDKQHFGLSTLTRRLLNQGNDGLDANTLANRLAETGANFSSENNHDMIILQLETLTQAPNQEQATALFARMIKHPDFPEKAFSQQKNQQRISIQQRLDAPDEVANQDFFQSLYQTHPYAHPINGNLETLDKITLKDVKNFHHDFFVSQNAVLVLVGAIRPADARSLAEQITRHIPKGHKAPEIPEAKPLTHAIEISRPFPSSQAVLRLGQLGITHHHPNYFPLLVGNYTLGGGALVSRLAHELREKRGLTYGVQSQFVPMPEKGPFIIGFSTHAKQAAAAEKITRETLKSFVQTGPNHTELNAAKQYLIGSFPLAIASNNKLSKILLKMMFYDLPNDYLETYRDKISAVNIQQIRAAFQDNIFPNTLLQVMVGTT